VKLIEKIRIFLNQKSQDIATIFWQKAITRLEEWEELGRPIESPVEQLFYISWLFKKFCDPDLALELCPQYQDKSTGKYRLDFIIDFIQEAYLLENRLEWDEAIFQTKSPLLGIEIDSHIWHEKTKEQVQYHKERERFLIANGWKLLRFTGGEVYKDSDECVQETFDIADKLRDEYHQSLYKKYEKK